MKDELLDTTDCYGNGIGQMPRLSGTVNLPKATFSNLSEFSAYD